MEMETELKFEEREGWRIEGKEDRGGGESVTCLMGYLEDILTILYLG